MLDLFRGATSRFGSRLLQVEANAAIARRVREGRIPRGEGERLHAALEADLETLVLVEMSSEIVRAATDLVRSERLRAYDAVHLASGLWSRDHVDSEVTFVCADRALARVAGRMGLGSLVPGR